MLENIRKLILKKLQLVLLWGKLRQYYIQKNSYFKKHARKGKNTRVRDFGNEKKKKKSWSLKQKQKILSLDDKDQKNVLNVRQIKV